MSEGINKKLGLLPFICSCKNEYCAAHRHNHNCTFDYKSKQKLILEKNNVKIEAPKITKI